MWIDNTCQLQSTNEIISKTKETKWSAVEDIASGKCIIIIRDQNHIIKIH